MKNFKETKTEILKRAKLAGACTVEYNSAENSKNIEELIQVVKDNLRFVYYNMDCKSEFLEEYFGIELLKQNHIYTSGKSEISIKEGQVFIYTLDSSSANVKTLGSSSANVKTLGSSSAIKMSVEGQNSFIRNHNERKIYVKKDNFTIVEL